jgi:hypothetical protein
VKDDWNKYRTKGQRLTARDVEFIREEYIARRSSYEVARELGCASRSIRAHYVKLRDAGIRRNGDPVPAVDRRYRGSFEVSE